MLGGAPSWGALSASGFAESGVESGDGRDKAGKAGLAATGAAVGFTGGTDSTGAAGGLTGAADSTGVEGRPIDKSAGPPAGMAAPGVAADGEEVAAAVAADGEEAVVAA